jgi:hypothetical protein
VIPDIGGSNIVLGAEKTHPQLGIAQAVDTGRALEPVALVVANGSAIAVGVRVPLPHPPNRVPGEVLPGLG